MPDRRNLFIVVAALVGAGALWLIARAPAITSTAWLKAPLIDDAYYYLTVARNVASGNGLTLGGQLVTGFQPLYLAACIGAGQIAGWDLCATPALITFMDWLVYNVVCLWLVLSVWRKLEPVELPAHSAWLVAGIWLLHNSGQRLAATGMETPFVLAAWLVAMLAAENLERREWSPGASAVAGAVLGLSFLVRNDAIVLAFGLFVLGVFRTTRGNRTKLPRRRILTAFLVCFGIATLVALPWVLYTLYATGSIIPQSGRAESTAGVYFQGRFEELYAAVQGAARNLLPMDLAQDRLSTLGLVPGIIMFGGTFCAAIAVLVYAFHWCEQRAKGVLAFGVLSYLALCIVYVVAFGAPHAMNRWLAPGAVMGTFGWAIVLARLRRHGRNAIVFSLLGLMLITRAAAAVSDSLQPYLTNTHRLLMAVQERKMDGVVASFQSGLLGWVRKDGVLNLDGKVNNAAMQAIEQGRIAKYVLDQKPKYVIDWHFFGLQRDSSVRSWYSCTELPQYGGLKILSRKPAPVYEESPCFDDSP